MVAAGGNERLFEFYLVPSCLVKLTKARKETRELKVSPHL